MKHIFEYSKFNDHISTIRDILEEDDLDNDKITVSEETVLRNRPPTPYKEIWIDIFNKSEENAKFIKSITDRYGRHLGFIGQNNQKILTEIENSNKTIRRICKLCNLLINNISFYESRMRIEFAEEIYKVR